MKILLDLEYWNERTSSFVGLGVLVRNSSGVDWVAFCGLVPQIVLTGWLEPEPTAPVTAGIVRVANVKKPVEN